jgi:phosphatidylglycerophosphatase A
MIKLHEIFLTFFFCGKAKKAPGTIGSFAAVIFWFLIAGYFFNSEVSFTAQNIFWAIFLLLAFIYGCYASPIYAKKFGQIDHGSIVLDEVVGQIFALQFTFIFLADYFAQPKLIAAHLLFCFIFFRFFDIKKPSFIGYADRNFKNGFGVMFDDLICGIVTAVIGFAIIKLTLIIL